jgi:hypothetical protein
MIFIILLSSQAVWISATLLMRKLDGSQTLMSNTDAED